MVKLKAKRLKASTLMEVIIAMVIILIVFVLGTGIYANVIRSSPSIKDQRLRSVAFSIIQESVTLKNWEDQVVDLDGMVVQKTVQPYLEYADLVLVTATVIEQEKELVKVRQVVRKENNE